MPCQADNANISDTLKNAIDFYKRGGPYLSGDSGDSGDKTGKSVRSKHPFREGAIPTSFGHTCPSAPRPLY